MTLPVARMESTSFGIITDSAAQALQPCHHQNMHERSTLSDPTGRVLDAAAEALEC
ncbi:hypothetical protein PISMIDRAFT_688569 [Pisolithus microcarpus 441]|uniref:Uncharacterized protein n=1 Tax=Pisolithus microcarpus 441 TaxID=765257 RepID=A0A0C9Z0T0_9AGAM|nr:hypothetical protein PISMIDRAFT_688569 [Pisolithus microcarpus 441]